MNRRGMPRRTSRSDSFGLQDLIVEASQSLGSSPSRLVTMSIGTVLGIASLVMTLGFAQTASSQVARQFDAVAATHVNVVANLSGDGTEDSVVIPWDADERVAKLSGVLDAGMDAVVRSDIGTISALALNDPSKPALTPPVVIAASPGIFGSAQARIRTGRVFDTGNEERGDHVAVLGAKAAERLGIDRVDNRPSLMIGNQAFSILGIIDRATSRPDLIDDIIVPLSVGRSEFGVRAPEQVHIRIAPGASADVSRQAPIAILPNAPDALSALSPETSGDLRQGVETDLNVVFLLLAVLALLAGVVGIATVTQFSVRERTAEIGLRRALGARQRDIAAQFMAEALIVSVLGGIVGAAAGVMALVVTATARGWTPVIDPLLLLCAVGAAALSGLVAGVVPASHASRIEPARALSGGAT